MRHSGRRPEPRHALWGAALGVAMVEAGCGGEQLSGHAGGAQVEVDVAPLDLAGISDASFNLRVVNGNEDLVWERLGLTVSAYGAGGGLSYVGPCDAAANPNRVELELVELVGPDSVGSWVNPAPPGTPITRSVACEANADRPVTFDLTIARAAEQGFFDVGVNFSDVFCSAKLDCATDDGDYQRLLHPEGGGERAPTVVVGFACTGGPDEADPTHLYLSDVRVTCGDETTWLDPSLGPGNAGAASDMISQTAFYRGTESLEGLSKCYWNSALAIDVTQLEGDCEIALEGTASAGPLEDGRVPAGAVYPTLRWSAPLTDPAGEQLACGRHGLDDGDGVVATGYTSAADGARFTYAFACGQDDVTVPGRSVCAEAGELQTAAGDVTLTEAPGGLTLQAGQARSPLYALPVGLTVGSCCPDDCCLAQ